MKKLVTILALGMLSLVSATQGYAIPVSQEVNQRAVQSSGFTIDEIRAVVSKSDLPTSEVNKIIDNVIKNFAANEDGKLNISGVLMSKGFNFSIFKDRKVWKFDAEFIPPGTNEKVFVKELYDVEFFNGGLKFELAHKWVFVFIPGTIDVAKLNNASYGRGLAIQIPFPFLPILHLEAGWMQGSKKVHGSAFFAAPTFGIAHSISFPKMIFKLNPEAFDKK